MQKCAEGGRTKPVSKTSVYQLDLTESSHKEEGLRYGRSLPP